MYKIKKVGLYVMFTLMFAVGFHIVAGSVEIAVSKKISDISVKIPEEVNEVIHMGVMNTISPGFSYTKEETILPCFLPRLLFEKYNLSDFVCRQVPEEAVSYEKIMVLEAMEEEEFWQDYSESSLGQGAEEEPEIMEEKPSEPVIKEKPVFGNPVGKTYSKEELKSYDFLMGQFYTVDKTTSIGKEILDGQVLSEMDLSIDKSKEGPKVLIYHTHSQEDFADSVPGNADTTIVGVGAYLKSILEEDYKVSTLHLTTGFDMVNGKLDRNKAYSQAEKAIKKVLEENPSIQIVIDLHRDGVGKDTRLVTNVNGKQTAQIMFFNGLSRTNTIGDIGYLKNPYLKENLALTLQMKLEAEKYFPGLARRIYLKGYRYNLHLSKGAMLVEAGAQTNTVEEVKNAMVPLSFLISKVLLE